jgi:hypothetical protein
MKIYAVMENGEQFEIKEIQCLGEGGSLVIQSEYALRRCDLDKYEKDMSEKLSRRVIVLNAGLKAIGTIAADGWIDELTTGNVPEMKVT